MPYRPLLAAILLGATLTAVATPKPDSDQAFNIAGAQTLKVAGFDRAMRTAALDLSHFDSVWVSAPELEFDRNWYRDHRFEMTDSDEKRIRETYTSNLQEALTKAFSEATQLQPATSAGERTLVVKPTLREFRLNGPDLSHAGIDRTYVRNVGSAQVEFALVDATGDRTLALLQDHDETPTFMGIGDFKWTNRAENQRDFNKLFRRWAGDLVAFLNPS